MSTSLGKIGCYTLLQAMGIVIVTVSNINVVRAAGPITNQLGFSVKGNKIIDNNTGNQFIPAGYNTTFAYYPPTTLNDLTTVIPQTGANSVRIFATQSYCNFKLGCSPSGTPALQEEIVQSSLQGGLVPIITEGATNGVSAFSKPGSCLDNGGKCGLQQAVNEWLSEKSMFQANPDLILNIANEWGSSAVTSTPAEEKSWAQGYKKAIRELRAAGINNLLLVDSGGSGQDPSYLLDYASQVEASDRDHKTAFSIHMYGRWTDGATNANSPYSIPNVLPQLAALKVPVIIGEFGGTDTNGGSFTPGNLVQEANQLGLGWEYWTYPTIHSTKTNTKTAAALSTNSTYGLKHLSKLPQYNLGSVSKSNAKAPVPAVKSLSIFTSAMASSPDNTKNLIGAPEPFNILGSIMALGFGISWKRKLSNRKNQKVKR